MARKAVSNDRYRYAGEYQRLRRTLLDLPRDGRLQQKLEYWVLPKDRRLPIALLDQPLSELLKLSIEELMATPGIGRKKIGGLFDLMRRVAKSAYEEEPFGLAARSADASANAPVIAAADPANISEAVWSTWCDTVKRNHLEGQKLGRLAPTLKTLPTVIWHTPLAEYVDLPLGEIRQLKTHGEKRVAAISQVFSVVHEALSTAVLHEDLEFDIAPRFVGALSRYLLHQLSETGLPSEPELRERVAEPLVAQIEIDLGDSVARLAVDRLRIGGEMLSVKQQADSLGVTRARVYQLLDDCAKVMAVRWPEGRWLLGPLTTRFTGASSESIGLVIALRDLFFPPTPTQLAENEDRATSEA